VVAAEHEVEVPRQQVAGVAVTAVKAKEEEGVPDLSEVIHQSEVERLRY
jgi:hypothetical protein